MNYYKILNEMECHNGLTYHDGLNVDPLPFNPSGKCESGGIYFASRDILAFLYVGPWIRQLTLPPGEPMYKDPSLPEKYKAHRVILGKRRKITPEVIKELVAEGADIHAGNDYAVGWAAKCGHLDVVRYLVNHGAKIHVDEDRALRLAARNGRLDVVRYLVNRGANIHADKDRVLRWATKFGRRDVVKYLKSCT